MANGTERTIRRYAVFHGVFAFPGWVPGRTEYVSREVAVALYGEGEEAFEVFECEAMGLQHEGGLISYKRFGCQMGIGVVFEAPAEGVA
jgi:hypothetical protein